jgi:hypothetical protein
MAKNNNSILKIFLQAIGLYFTNIDRFIWYMLFPVFGQLACLILTIIILYTYNVNKAVILANFPILQTELYMQISLFVVIVPVILLWIKAVWDYMVAYSAVNSMTENMLKSERVYDFPAHTMMVTRRWLPYIRLFILYAGLLSLTATVIFAGFVWVLAVYYAFIFQIFMFEPDLSPADCFKKSSSYVQGKFKETLFMIALVGGLTYIILPQIILTFLDTVKATNYLRDLILPYISVPSLDLINMILSAAGVTQIMPVQVALFIVKLLVIVITIQLLLPLRVICMCLWYKNFYNDAGAMKKLDDSILERAEASKKNKKK